MKNFLVLILFISFYQKGVNAQRFIVRFKDKNFSAHTLSNPASYLSPRAIDRRQRFAISLDSSDLPVTARYLDSLLIIPGVALLNSSKWLNQVSIRITDPEALNKINKLPFVLTTSRIASRIKTETSEANLKQDLISSSGANIFATHITDVYNKYGNSANQVNIHYGAFLHNIGLRGNGKIIGMLDAGYENFNRIKSLDSAIVNGQILNTWDFVDGNSNVVDDNSHGTLCFSILGGNLPGTFVGTAPKAGYLLFRTEDFFSESPIEEHNWVCGAERIDSAGGDLISSSLGYMVFDDPSLNYRYEDMNGNTTMIAKGADLAAKKGLLVVSAAGNEGNTGWHYIISPADGDSVLAVGSVNSSGIPANSSSYGPSFDGQVKPDVSSLGQGAAVQFPNGSFGTSNGTSLACPNIAGLITCLMQGFPEFNNMEIMNAVR
ncbi:MAG TPA: S8 family serine peptidase, partial [Chitinophagaceae bacterium]|nr:S8 family serine peptidase [Chitinophagaceae bacterium]